MKKIRFISLFVFLVLLLTSVMGCGVRNEQDADYIALEIGTFDADDGGKHTSEYATWDETKTNYHQDAEAAGVASVTFNGVTYSGNYQRSATKIPNLYVSHRYKGENVFFEVNGSTGELTSITFVYEPSEAYSMSQDQCKQIADSIADDYITVSEYEVDIDSQAIYSNYLYTFSYYRKVSGYRTADSLTISIDGNGNVSSFGKAMLGSFDDIEAVIVDNKKAQDTIVAKLESIYHENSKHKDYSIDNIMLIKLDDGTCAFLYTIDNRFEDVDISFGSRVQLLMKTTQTSRNK